MGLVMFVHGFVDVFPVLLAFDVTFTTLHVMQQQARGDFVASHMTPLEALSPSVIALVII